MNRLKLFLSLLPWALFFINITPTYAHNIKYTYVKESEEYLRRVVYVKQNEYLKRVNSIFFKRELNCLAKNIYFEAGNQNTRGMLAVGLVTINRILSPTFPDTICDVVKEKNNVRIHRRWRVSCQFSWFCDGKSDNPDRQSEMWRSAIFVANRLLVKGQVKDFTKGALYFHADYVKPKWRKEMTFIAKINDHLFYKPQKS